MTPVTKMPQATSVPSASDRPTMTAARGIGSDRSRSYTPVAESSATPAAALMPVHRIDGDEEAGHEEVDVVDGAAGVDGAAEHVAEHEQEQRALDGAHHEELRGAEELQDACGARW